MTSAHPFPISLFLPSRTGMCHTASTSQNCLILIKQLKSPGRCVGYSAPPQHPSNLPQDDSGRPGNQAHPSFPHPSPSPVGPGSSQTRAPCCFLLSQRPWVPASCPPLLPLTSAARASGPLPQLLLGAPGFAEGKTRGDSSVQKSLREAPGRCFHSTCSLGSPAALTQTLPCLLKSSLVRLPRTHPPKAHSREGAECSFGQLSPAWHTGN